MGTRIWRYTDLAKTIHLLAAKTLHFTRIDQFDDRFEGSYPVQNLKDWESQYPKVGDFNCWRKFGCVSCWYEADNESAAMWELYSKGHQGIAILSTKDRLKESLESDQPFCENVKYIDFLREKASIKTPLDVFLYKRTEFNYEQEYRAVLFKLPQSDGCDNGIPRYGSVEKQAGFPEHGKDIPVDPEVLIENLVLSPYAKPWYRELVEEVLSKYGVNTSILAESELAADPVYPRQ